MGNEYLEVKIFKQVCYVDRNDFKIVSCLAGNLTAAAPRTYQELPDDASIVKVYLIRKWNTGRRKKQIGIGWQHAETKG